MCYNNNLKNGKGKKNKSNAILRRKSCVRSCAREKRSRRKTEKQRGVCLSDDLVETKWDAPLETCLVPSYFFFFFFFLLHYFFKKKLILVYIFFIGLFVKDSKMSDRD